MSETFALSIDDVANMTGTQIAALLRGYEILKLKAQNNASEGGKLPNVKYGKLKKKG